MSNQPVARSEPDTWWVAEFTCFFSTSNKSEIFFWGPQCFFVLIIINLILVFVGKILTTQRIIWKLRYFLQVVLLISVLHPPGYNGQLIYTVKYFSSLFYSVITITVGNTTFIISMVCNLWWKTCSSFKSCVNRILYRTHFLSGFN